MLKHLLSIGFLLVLGCSLPSKSERQAELEYEAMISEWNRNAELPTPKTWQAGNVWTFIYLNKDHEIIRSLKVMLTSERVCVFIGGDEIYNYRMEILNESPRREPEPYHQSEIASYSAEGINANFKLRCNIGDGGMSVSGVLTEQGFVGEERLSSHFCAPDCPEPIINLVVGVPDDP